MRLETNPSSLAGAIVVAAILIAVSGWVTYNACLIEVPSRHMAILIHKVGEDIENGDEIAPSPDHKGVQKAVLAEGRYFYNPLLWDWVVLPQIEIPAGKLGVRIRLYGDELPAGQLIANKENEKGIVPGVLNPGRYPINARLADAKPGLGEGSFAEIIEMHDPVTIPAGYKGVVTLLSEELPKTPNTVLSVKGERGVQAETLDPGTYYINPYLKKVCLVDCRSQRYSLKDIGFPTKDGFWVSLEGVMEFRVNPKEAPKVYVLYNESFNGDQVDEEVIQKILLPNARAYTRLRGSNYSGKEFIAGDTRAKFQEDFQKHMQSACAKEGIEVIQALITAIKPPEQIAEPVRRRQIALQQEAQYKKEIEQQIAEQELAVQKATVEQKKAQVTANQEVVVITVDAQKKQEVALIDANKRLMVAQQKLEAAKDQAAATIAKGKAEADVIKFTNQALAAGWQKSVEAFSGNGHELARYTLFKKLAPAFQSIMANTQSSTLMDIFRTFDTTAKGNAPSKKE